MSYRANIVRIVLDASGFVFEQNLLAAIDVLDLFVLCVALRTIGFPKEHLSRGTNINLLCSCWLCWFCSLVLRSSGRFFSVSLKGLRQI